MQTAVSTFRPHTPVQPGDRTEPVARCAAAIEGLLSAEHFDQARVHVEYGDTSSDQTVMVRGFVPTDKAADFFAGLQLIADEFPRLIRQPSFSNKGEWTEIFGVMI